jgi:hypothetical protein
MPTTAIIRRLAAVTLGASVALALPGPARAAPFVATTPVTGAWANEFCLFTNYDASNGAGECTASSQWTGTWNGVTVARYTGTLDAVTGEGKGAIDETFAGRASDGRTGTLHFQGTVELSGADHSLHIVETMIDSTGDFAGSAGTVTFDGISVGGAGIGGIRGQWTAPAR